MPEQSDAEARAKKLRERIVKLKRINERRQEEAAAAPPADGGPRAGESPHAYVERRMRETLKKKL
jgi:hypothetical protein